MLDAILNFLDLSNETLAAAIVVVATSMLLYNITRNFTDRVARTSGIVLACVTVAYIADVFVSLDPGRQTQLATLRLQWIGIAFIPAALFHLSDALLATTGLSSRGRRRRVVRVMYLLSAMFLLLAATTDTLVRPVLNSLRAAELFPVYLAYFITASIAAFINVNRARERCLTRSTKRRMAYLQFAMLTPVLGIFPFSALLEPNGEFSLGALLLVNLANIIVILMLLFLAYPLSFFGSRIPDRVVKAELLRFMLRGPATGLLILATMIFMPENVMGIDDESFLPFAVVGIVLFWQWMVDLALPTLERLLIYHDEDTEQVGKILEMSRRILTRSDLLQLLEGILETSCDFLRVNNAFIASFYNGQPEMIKAVGHVDLTTITTSPDEDTLPAVLQVGKFKPQRWTNYWVMPLYSRRTNGSNKSSLIGVMGVETLPDINELTIEEEQVLKTLRRRAAQAVDDLMLQSEVYAALEGLLPQIAAPPSRAVDVEYRAGRSGTVAVTSPMLDRGQIIEQVQAALRHYWGGPGLTNSRLLELNVVRAALEENDNNPLKALRAVIRKAIEQQRPSGERNFKSQEWTIYNILHLRFIENKKARETASRLYMAEASMYRKQNLAIEAVADTIIKMEMETFIPS